MRPALVIVLSVIASAPAAAADTPIPQDTARLEKRRAERLEWNRQTVRGAYDKVGKKDPRWDEPVHKTMDLAARMFSEQVDPEVTFLDIHKSAQAAVDAGCDDPLLLYLHVRCLVGPAYPGEDEAIRRMRAAAAALAASRYPAYRRAVARQWAGTYAASAKAPGEASRKGAERDFDAALALLPESVASEERNQFWEDGWFNTLLNLIQGYRALGIAAPAAYERVDAGLAKVPEMKALRLQLRGSFWYTYGWEARTTNFARNVPAGGFESFEKRIETARKAFAEAWRLRPDDARTADHLLDIEKAVGSDRAAMELWFERALKADGDKYSACLTKLDWLDPKWHGTAEEMLAFGRACRATKNWYAGITLLAGDAHFRYASKLGPAERSKYLGSPEVRSEIKSVYEEYLKHHPNADAARSKYAALCYLGADYHEAAAQFQALVSPDTITARNSDGR